MMIIILILLENDVINKNIRKKQYPENVFQNISFFTLNNILLSDLKFNNYLCIKYCIV